MPTHHFFVPYPPLFFHLVRPQPRLWPLLVLLLLVLAGTAPPSQAQRVAADPVLRSLVIWQAVADPAGWVWLATDRGGYRYDGHQLVPLRELVRQGPALPAGSMRAVLRDADGGLWWGGTAGLWAFRPDSGRLRAVALPDYPAKRLGVTALGWHRGRLWVGRDADPFAVFSLLPNQSGPSVRAEVRHAEGWVTGFAPDSLGRWRVQAGAGPWLRSRPVPGRCSAFPCFSTASSSALARRRAGCRRGPAWPCPARRATGSCGPPASTAWPLASMPN